MSTIRAAERPHPPLAWLALLALPMVGLAVLIARPELDLEWRHQPSHFWLVLIVAAINVALAYLTNEAAMRRRDARLFLISHSGADSPPSTSRSPTYPRPHRRRDARLLLISLAFGSSAGFLGLHALATPGVLLPGPNLGFVIATPVGLTIAAVLAAAAALPLGGPRGELVLRHAGTLRAALLAAIGAWGAASILGIPAPFWHSRAARGRSDPLPPAGCPPQDRSGW